MFFTPTLSTFSVVAPVFAALALNITVRPAVYDVSVTGRATR